jgi:hypothetical protein
VAPRDFEINHGVRAFAEKRHITLKHVALNLFPSRLVRRLATDHWLPTEAYGKAPPDFLNNFLPAPVSFEGL